MRFTDYVRICLKSSEHATLETFYWTKPCDTNLYLYMQIGLVGMCFLPTQHLIISTS